MFNTRLAFAIPNFVLAAVRGQKVGHGAKGVFCEDGASLVEMALASVVVFAMLFGIIEISFALYTYDYVSDAAREGSRYAIVRGSTSCTNTPSLAGCNATATQVGTYVKNLGYPGINAALHMTVTTTWLKASAAQPTTWSVCSVGTCNAPGSLVKVQVVYAFPIGIPFWRTTTWNMASSSQMAIAQ